MSWANPQLVETLVRAWSEFKRLEGEAQAKRREVEDKLRVYADLNMTAEKTVEIYSTESVRMTAQVRLNRKVNEPILESIVHEAGAHDLYKKLFRVSHEVNVKTWNETPEAVRSLFAPAITVTPGRPTFAVKHQGE